MQGYGYVGDSVVVEAELMAQVAKQKFKHDSSISCS